MLGGKWDGFADIRQTLEGIISEVARDEVLQQALLDGVGKPMTEEMHTRLYTVVTRRTGATGEALEARAATAEEAGTVMVKIGPRTKGSRGGIAAAGFKVKFWEFGTSRLPARPFMRPVYDEWQGRITGQFLLRIRPVYERAVARYAKRAK